MTCPDCTRAAEQLHHGFAARCPGCQSRAIARGPDYFRVRKAGKLDPTYQSLLDRIGADHAAVKAAAQADHLTSGRWREGTET